MKKETQEKQTEKLVYETPKLEDHGRWDTITMVGASFTLPQSGEGTFE